MNNILLYKLPNCDSSDKDMCSVDPTTLLLENVNKHFHGNFSCIGALSSGLSSLMSNTVALQVHYPPGKVSLLSNSNEFSQTFLPLYFDNSNSKLLEGQILMKKS